MPPNHESVLRRLQSDAPKERLEIARYLAQHAEPQHEHALREAIARERILWITSALRRALARITPDPELESTVQLTDRDDLPQGFAAQVYSEALETTTSQLMHEIEPLLGSLRLAAEAEIADFQQSTTRRTIDRLDEFLEALARLRRAASAPKIEEFSLDETIQRCIQETPYPADIVVQKSGAQPCIVEGDSGLVSLAFTNGLRNAIDATCEIKDTSARVPIAIAWGTTDVDSWVSIVDAGIGFKGNILRAFEIGTTTKEGHLGMGLATANQAASSMGGRVVLVPNERGVRFEMRWPQKTT